MRRAEVQDAERGEENRLGQTDALALQDSDEKHPRDDEGGVEYIDAADDAGAHMLGRVGLDRGEEGHDEKPAGGGEAGDVAGDAEAGRRAQKSAVPISAIAVGEAPGRQSRDRAGKARHAKRGERDRTQQDAAARDKGGGERADPDAEREKGADRRLDADAAAGLVADDDGDSESVTAPAIQNQETDRLRLQELGSRLTSRRRPGRGKNIGD